MLSFGIAIALWCLFILPAYPSTSSNPATENDFFQSGLKNILRGNYQQAIQDFSEVIRLNPSSGQAYVNRGVAYHLLGYQQSAIADLSKASEFFQNQGQKLAYEKTLSLLKIMRQNISSELEIAMAKTEADWD